MLDLHEVRAVFCQNAPLALVFIVSGLCLLQSMNALRGALTIPETTKFTKTLTFYDMFRDEACLRCIEKGKSLCWSALGFGMLALYLSYRFFYNKSATDEESNAASSTTTSTSTFLSRILTPMKKILHAVRRSKICAILIPTMAVVFVVVEKTRSLNAHWTWGGAQGNLTRELMLFLNVWFAYFALYGLAVLFVMGRFLWWLRETCWATRRSSQQKGETTTPNSSKQRRYIIVFVVVVVLLFVTFGMAKNTTQGSTIISRFRYEDFPTPFDHFMPSFLKEYPNIYDMRSTVTGTPYTFDCSAFTNADVSRARLQVQDDDALPSSASPNVGPNTYEEVLPRPVAAYVPRWIATLLAKPQACSPSTRIVPEFSHYAESPQNEHAIVVAGRCPRALVVDDTNGLFGPSIPGNVGSESYPRPLLGGGNGNGVTPRLRAEKYKRTQRPIIVVEDLLVNFIGKMVGKPTDDSLPSDGSETCGFNPADQALGAKIAENWQRRVNNQYGGVDPSKASISAPFYCAKTKRQYIVSRDEKGDVKRVILDLNDVVAREAIRMPSHEVLEKFTDASPTAKMSRRRQREEMLQFYNALGLRTKRQPAAAGGGATKKKSLFGITSDDDDEENGRVYLFTVPPGSGLVTVLCGEVEEFHVGRLPHTNGTRHFTAAEKHAEEQLRKKQTQATNAPPGAVEYNVAAFFGITSNMTDVPTTESRSNQQQEKKGTDVEKERRRRRRRKKAAWKSSKAWTTRKQQRSPKVHGVYILFIDATSRPDLIRQLPRTVKWLRRRSIEGIPLRTQQTGGDEVEEEEEREVPKTSQGSTTATIKKSSSSSSSRVQTAVAVEFPGFTTVDMNTRGNLNAMLGGHTIMISADDMNPFVLAGVATFVHTKDGHKRNEDHYKRYLREHNVFAKAKARYWSVPGEDDDDVDDVDVKKNNKNQFDKIDKMFTAFIHENAEDSLEVYWGSTSTSNSTGHGDHNRDVDAHYIAHAAHRFNCQNSNFEGSNSIQRRCFGRRHAVDVNVRLAQSLLQQARDQEKRFLVFSHLLDGHEGTLTQVHVLDDYIVRQFHELESEGFFEENAIIFMSDHGNHMGPQWELAEAGPVERAMPFVTLLLPHHLVQKHRSALDLNRRQLTSGFDVHGTILDLLGLDDEVPDHASTKERESGSYYCTSVQLGGHNATRTTEVVDSGGKKLLINETYKRIPSYLRRFEAKRNTCESVRSQDNYCVLSNVCKKKKTVRKKQ